RQTLIPKSRPIPSSNRSAATRGLYRARMRELERVDRAGASYKARAHKGGLHAHPESEIRVEGSEELQQTTSMGLRLGVARRGVLSPSLRPQIVASNTVDDFLSADRSSGSTNYPRHRPEPRWRSHDGGDVLRLGAHSVTAVYPSRRGRSIRSHSNQGRGLSRGPLSHAARWLAARRC